MRDDKKLIGSILVKQRSVTEADVENGLRQQRSAAKPKPLVSILLESGVLSETDALRGLSEQLGVPGIDLTQVAILLSHLDLIPREVALANRMLPVLAREDRLFLAIANPLDQSVIDELEFTTGRKIFPYVAAHVTLELTTRAAFDAKARGETYYLAPNVPETTLAQLGLTPSQTPPSALAPPSVARASVSQVSAVNAKQRRAAPSMRSGSIPAIDRLGANAKVEGPPRNMATPFDEGARDTSSRETVRPKEVEALGPGAYAHLLDAAVRRIDENEPPASSPNDAITNPVSARKESDTPAGPGRLVLIVDDEPEIRAIISDVVTRMGHRFVEADKGRAALAAVKDHAPDLVVLDAMLPELHGFDIARRIKASPRFSATPIIMISGVYTGWRIAQDLRENYGVEELLEKPFTIDELETLLSRYLSGGEPDNLAAEARHPDHVTDEAGKLLQRSVEAYKSGDVVSAIQALQNGIELDPRAYRLRYHLALLYGKLGRVYDGISELERAVELAPRHFPALKNLAILYEKAGLKSKAVEIWERCVNVAPEDDTKTSIKEHLLTLL